MTDVRLQTQIEKAFEDRATINAATRGHARDAVDEALDLLDRGKARVAEKLPGATGPNSWKVNQWLKKAVLLSFRLNDNALIDGGPGQATWWDKIPSKMEGWGENRFKDAGFRAVPGAIVRRSAFIARDVVLMPSFVNLGAYVDEKTMVDTWVTVGSCAQIGKNVHLSGGVGIGGVLEPLQANPTIIEDDCFIGARSEVVEGVIIGEGSVLSMGVFISASTKVIDRASGKVHVGHVPPYSVVVPGSLPGKPLPDGSPGTLALLRRDRENRRRPDAGENGNQRTPAGVRGDCRRRSHHSAAQDALACQVKFPHSRTGQSLRARAICSTDVSLRGDFYAWNFALHDERRVRRRSRASGAFGRAGLGSGGRYQGLQPVRRVRQQFGAVRHGDDRRNKRKRDRDRRFRERI